MMSINLADWCLEMEDFKIDTMGTYHGLTLKSVTEGVANKQALNDPTAAVKQPSMLSLFSFRGYRFLDSKQAVACC